MKKGFRPTKAASKRRRDLLNAEISRIRNLLPFTEIQRQRLSQIQVMSLCNAYIGLKSFLTNLCLKDDNSEHAVNGVNLTQIFPGFLLIVSNSGQVLYVSGSVIDYLGYSAMELLTQGDSIYDFIKADDQSNLRLILESMSLPDAFSRHPRSVSCRMFLAQNFQNLYGYHHYRTMSIKGRIIRRPSRGSQCGAVPEAIFVALVIPHSKPFFDSLDFPSFQTIHNLDMKFTEIEHNGCIWLGYSEHEVKSKSWYAMMHPDDIPRAKEIHSNIIRCQQRDGPSSFSPSSLCVRFQTRYGHFVWLRVEVILRKCADKLEIICNNCVVTDENAGEVLGERNHADSARTDPSGHESRAFCGALGGDGTGLNKKKLSSSFGSSREVGATRESSSGHLSKKQRTTAQSSLESPYPLLKAILNRPTIRSLHGSSAMQSSTFNPSQPGPQPGVAFADALLTPQNSPRDTVSQECSHNENLSSTGMYAAECLPNSVNVWEMNSASQPSWEQANMAYNYCETPPLDQADNVMEIDSILAETESSSFEPDVESMPLDVIVDALKAMQNDPEISKEVDNLDLVVFSKSFPELEKKDLFSSNLPFGSPANPLLNVLLPYMNSPMTKLSSTQVDTLNQRLSELKKIHETLVFEAVVETLHCGNSKTSSCWNELQDLGSWKEVKNL